MNMHFQRALLGLVVAILAACGGGGSSQGNNDDTRNTDNTDKYGNAQTLQLLQNGIYEMGILQQYDTTSQASSVTLRRERRFLENGLLQTETSELTSGGWIGEDEDFSSDQDNLLALTAFGWGQHRADAPCSVDDTAGGVILNCFGMKSRLSLDPMAELTTASLADIFRQIADVELGNQTAAHQTVTAVTAPLTNAVGAEARSYEFSTVSQDSGVLTLSCAPTAADQPMTEWSCRQISNSSSLEELTQNNGIFGLYYVSELGARLIIAQLESDPGNENSGNIVVLDDVYMDEIPPLTIVGTWEKLDIHGQSIIRLIHSGADSRLGLDQALTRSEERRVGK